MKNRLITILIFNISIIFGQSYISYDLSNQFGFVLDNNQIIWDNSVYLNLRVCLKLYQKKITNKRQ